MKAHLYLGISIIALVVAMAIIICGICIPDKLHLLLSGFIYLAIAYIFYDQHQKAKEDDGI